MRNLTLAAAITAIAIALTVPFTLAQTTPKSDTAPAAESSRGSEVGPGMMYRDGQGQGQRTDQPGAMGGSTQGQRSDGPTMMYGQGQGQGGYGPGMMGSSGIGWMSGYGGYGGMLVPILLVIVVAGLVAWVVAKRKGT